MEFGAIYVYACLSVNTNFTHLPHWHGSYGTRNGQFNQNVMHSEINCIPTMMNKCPKSWKLYWFVETVIKLDCKHFNLFTENDLKLSPFYLNQRD